METGPRLRRTATLKKRKGREKDEQVMEEEAAPTCYTLASHAFTRG
jgi:hypothetical protein